MVCGGYGLSVFRSSWGFWVSWEERIVDFVRQGKGLCGNVAEKLWSEVKRFGGWGERLVWDRRTWGVRGEVGGSRSWLVGERVRYGGGGFGKGGEGEWSWDVGVEGEVLKRALYWWGIEVARFYWGRELVFWGRLGVVLVVLVELLMELGGLWVLIGSFWLVEKGLEGGELGGKGLAIVLGSLLRGGGWELGLLLCLGKVPGVGAGWLSARQAVLKGVIPPIILLIPFLVGSWGEGKKEKEKGKRVGQQGKKQKEGKKEKGIDWERVELKASLFGRVRGVRNRAFKIVSVNINGFDGKKKRGLINLIDRHKPDLLLL
jgi:hypothetical protein